VLRVKDVCERTNDKIFWIVFELFSASSAVYSAESGDGGIGCCEGGAVMFAHQTFLSSVKLSPRGEPLEDIYKPLGQKETNPTVKYQDDGLKMTSDGQFLQLMMQLSAIYMNCCPPGDT